LPSRKIWTDILRTKSTGYHPVGVYAVEGGLQPARGFSLAPRQRD
jgi:hypothetical protein